MFTFHRLLVTMSLLAGSFALSGSAKAGEVFIDFKTYGTQQGLTLTVAGVELTADDGSNPAEVLMLNLNGLGVVGGAADSTTDGSEGLHFDFGFLVTNAEYHVGVANNLDADGKVGESFVGTTSLGLIAQDDVGWHNVSALFGGVSVTAFTVHADVDGNRIDAMRYGTPWVKLGTGLPGTHDVPTLSGSGPLAPFTPMAITADNMLENTSAALVAGFSALNASFKGGVMIPQVDLLIAGLPTGALGSFTFPATWPGNIPSGFTFYAQVWVTDPAGPQGFAATNGMSGTTP